MPRLSALLDVQQVSEIVDVIDSDTLIGRFMLEMQLLQFNRVTPLK